jgi:hypothetical protein
MYQLQMLRGNRIVLPRNFNIQSEHCPFATSHDNVAIVKIKFHPELIKQHLSYSISKQTAW